MGIRQSISDALDYSWPVAGGLAAILHALIGDDRFSRWLRDNAEHEPEPVA